MPTRFGDMLRSTEARIVGRYGIDPVACWPALWLLLTDADRAEVSRARAAIDTRVQASLRALLACAWAVVAGPSWLRLHSP